MVSPAIFKKKIWVHYRTNGRKLAWRETRDPYRILVSEIMLQQTQVSRVEPFYEKFIKRFPNFQTLARAKMGDVLRVWQGLGYNRRALALQRLAKTVVKEHDGRLPKDRLALESLPGIGSYTAGAVRAFAFSEPEIFIETNIRRVFIYFFFPKRKKVRDEEIRIFATKTLDVKHVRDWYYALMDYGSMLGAAAGKKNIKNPNRRSAHYAKQSKFSGSDRELRGQVLRLLLARKKILPKEIFGILSQPEERIVKVVSALRREGFVKQKGIILQLA
jgi:A/G-specific adenine glycosylase